jgi:hypothetical protein
MAPAIADNYNTVFTIIRIIATDAVLEVPFVMEVMSNS